MGCTHVTIDSTVAVRDDLRWLREDTLRSLRFTTIPESRRQERKAQSHRRHHSRAHVNLERETGRLSFHVHTAGNDRDRIVCRLVTTPWREVLPDVIRAAPVHVEVLSDQGPNGLLVRLVRRGYLQCPGLALGDGTVMEFASYTFRVPHVPISVGPEFYPDAVAAKELRGEDPDASAAWLRELRDSGLDQPLNLGLLRSLVGRAKEVVIFLDGQQVSVSALHDGHKMCWVSEKAPWSPGSDDELNSLLAGEPGVWLVPFAGVPAPRRRRMATAQRTPSQVNPENNPNEFNLQTNITTTRKLTDESNTPNSAITQPLQHNTSLNATEPTECERGIPVDGAALSKIVTSFVGNPTVNTEDEQ